MFLKSGKRVFFLSLFLVLLVLVALAFTLFHFLQQPPSRQQTQPGQPTAGIPAHPANIDFPASNNGTPAAYGSYSQQALQNPNVGGVDINMTWSDVEPQRGVYNFGPLDATMAAWGNLHKKFTLIIRYAIESGITGGTNCNIRQFLPAWELARIHYFCDTDRRMLIPDYFDPVFQQDLKVFVKAIADHIDQSSYKTNLLYARIGLGLAGEGFPLMPCRRGEVRCNYTDYLASRNQLVAYGYSAQHWESWQERMLSYFKSVFHDTTIIYPINQLDRNPATGHPVQMDVAYWAAAHGCGVGTQGLVPVPNYSYAQLNVILPTIIQKYPHTFIQFQTVQGVGSSSIIQGDIQTADTYGARAIEWYESDITNPSFQPLFQQWQQKVNSKFASASTARPTP
jgi:hypothetical protein